jgi:molybdopterin converting factor small subunit
VSGTVNVKVRLFASHREIMGTGMLEMELREGATLSELFLQLAAREPRIADLQPFTSFALNREMAEPGTHLKSGDEVALIQPVAGGIT